MAHYPYCFTINRLQLAVKLGWYDDERRRPQPVDLYMRLFFPMRPDCVDDDFAHFIDYDKLCQGVHALVSDTEYRLIEFMTSEFYQFIRRVVDESGHPEVKIWLNVVKVAPPVPHLIGGASFIYSDLAPDDTTIQVA